MKTETTITLFELSGMRLGDDRVVVGSNQKPSRPARFNGDNSGELSFFSPSHMQHLSFTSPIARAATAFLSAMWTAAGWYLVLT